MNDIENRLEEIIARNGGKDNPNDIAALAAILLEIVGGPKPATQAKVE